jgi:hypothetical protein
MNKKQEDKLAMYNAVLNHASQNARVVETLPALQNAYGALKAIVSAITSTMQEQMLVTKGLTLNKAEKRAALCNFANEIAGGLHAWANDKKDIVIRQKTKTTLSALRQLRDEELAPVCRSFYDIAIAGATDIEVYGLTTEVLNAYNTAIENYYNIVTSPRNAVAIRSAYVQKQKELFKDADNILKGNIDKLNLHFRKNNPDFAETYKANRVIINSGATKTALRILVAEEKDGLRIGEAAITINTLNLQMLTDSEGQAIAKPISHGVHTVSISKEGYTTSTISDIRVIRGKINTIEAILQKII